MSAIRLRPAGYAVTFRPRGFGFSQLLLDVDPYQLMVPGE